MTTDSETMEQYLNFVRTRFLISVLVFVSLDYELGRVSDFGGVDRQSRTGLIFTDCSNTLSHTSTSENFYEVTCYVLRGKLNYANLTLQALPVKNLFFKALKPVVELPPL